MQACNVAYLTLLTLICPQLLIEKFREFARDTTNTGTERVAATNAVCDQLIGTGHSDAATIAEWKDQINQSWADLLELIETRTKVSETCMTMLNRDMSLFCRPQTATEE